MEVSLGSKIQWGGLTRRRKMQHQCHIGTVTDIMKGGKVQCRCQIHGAYHVLPKKELSLLSNDEYNRFIDVGIIGEET